VLLRRLSDVGWVHAGSPCGHDALPDPERGAGATIAGWSPGHRPPSVLASMSARAGRAGDEGSWRGSPPPPSAPGQPTAARMQQRRCSQRFGTLWHRGAVGTKAGPALSGPIFLAFSPRPQRVPPSRAPLPALAAWQALPPGFVGLFMSPSAAARARAPGEKAGSKVEGAVFCGRVLVPGRR